MVKCHKPPRKSGWESTLGLMNTNRKKQNTKLQTPLCVCGGGESFSLCVLSAHDSITPNRKYCEATTVQAFSFTGSENRRQSVVRKWWPMWKTMALLSQQDLLMGNYSKKQKDSITLKPVMLLSYVAALYHRAPICCFVN